MSEHKTTDRHPLDCAHGIGTPAISIAMDGTETEGFTHWLCGWGQTPEALASLVGAPPWVGRNVSSGHLMSDGDCARCPAFVLRAGT
jgi:hypothetical protein